MNLLDSLIGWISPRTGLERAQARVALSAVRAYAAAQPRRANDDWIRPGTSGNAEVAASRQRLANTGSALERDNPYINRIVKVLASAIVGCDGMVPLSRTGDDALDAQVDALWAQFSDSCDASGVTNWAGLQTQAVRAVIERGEALGRFRPRPPEDGLPVPFQLQLLEGDYLDGLRTGIALPDDGYIEQGIEFDRDDRRRAYFLFRAHPGDAAILRRGITSVRVPAFEVVHLFVPPRIGVHRGVSWLAPVALRARDLDDLEDASISKAKVEACFAALVTRKTAGPARPNLFPQKEDAAPDSQAVELAPGMIIRLNWDEEVSFANPTSSGAFGEVAMHTLLAMAVGAGVTYDQLSGDLRQANYSSLRAGKIEQRRLIDGFQYQFLVPQFAEPVRRRFIATAVMAGLLPPRDGGYPAEWQQPKHEAVDPLKDTLADIALVRSGAMTPQQFHAKHGWNWKDQLRAWQAFATAADTAGLIFDIDPRKTTGSGAVQAPDLVADRQP